MKKYPSGKVKNLRKPHRGSKERRFKRRKAKQAGKSGWRIR